MGGSAGRGASGEDVVDQQHRWARADLMGWCRPGCKGIQLVGEPQLPSQVVLTQHWSAAGEYAAVELCAEEEA
jgi:hypothetical protein